jgi:GT2 family glycosyltransferase
MPTPTRQGTQTRRAIDLPLSERARFERLLQALNNRVAKQEKAIQHLRAEVRVNRARLLRQRRWVRDLFSSDQAERSIDGTTPEQAAYRRVVRRTRAIVTEITPLGSSVLVINKGDPAMLKLPNRQAWPFPQAADGSYAGYNPKSSTAAIVQLEALRARGAQYLVLPVSAFWWLDYYREFREHLESRYRLLCRYSRTCAVFALSDVAGARCGSIVEEAIAEFRRRFDRDPDILDWGTGLELASSSSQCTLAQCASDKALPYLDRTIDLVVMSSATADRLRDATRVASGAVVIVPAGSNGAPKTRGSIKWRADVPDPPGVTTSIIIPTYNGLARVQACVRALRETLPRDFAGEIVVVDDGSDALTRDGLSHLAGTHRWLKVVRNRRNSGFVESCNAGAAADTGDMLVFLNDDTIPLPQWLTAVLDTFKRRPDAGAVGGKLIFPDGRLQEAGGVVFFDGSGANFGKWDLDPDGALYSYVREVDYCSGALLATPRRLFAEIGGFDRRYCPAYYEDTDYCFAVREKGYGVYYQPECRIIHCEGATGGTDQTSGTKRYQAINRTKFVEKWALALKTQPSPPSTYDDAVWHSLAVRCTLHRHNQIS